jgi:hypothetical protein
VHYRSLAVFSLGWWSTPLQTGFRVSGPTHVRRSPANTTLRVQDSNPLRCPVPAGFRSRRVRQRENCRPLHLRRSTPSWHRRQAVPPERFGLLPVRSPLLGESSLLLEVLRCFSSPGALRNCSRCPTVRRAGCPIRRSPDHWLPAPPRSISPRGRVLPRPPTPRHPPCALHAEALIRLRCAAIAAGARVRPNRLAPERRCRPPAPSPAPHPARPTRSRPDPARRLPSPRCAGGPGP